MLWGRPPLSIEGTPDRVANGPIDTIRHNSTLETASTVESGPTQPFTGLQSKTEV
jgi:hypothetical protein